MAYVAHDDEDQDEERGIAGGGSPPDEVLISVDVETSGPTPGTGSLIAIGACPVFDPDRGFYREVAPVPGLPWDDATTNIHGLDRDTLQRRGRAPEMAMDELERWVDEVRRDRRAVFVGFNAPFDWMFVADYFWRYLGRNPFGYAALDLKALFMGRDGIDRFAATTKAAVAARYPVAVMHTHQALDDARMQAALARRLLRDPR